MRLFLALQLLISAADQTRSFDTLRYEGRDALVQSRYADAERLLKAAIQQGEQEGIVDHPLRAVVLSDLAETYRLIGQSDAAETYFKESVSILRRSPDFARAFVMVLNNLGALYRTRGQYLRAAACFEEAMTVAKKSLPANDALFGTILHGLAAVSSWKGDLQNAQKQLERSLRIREASLGSESYEVADTLNSLGTLQLQRKQYSKAEDNFRRSLSRLENLYGPNHSDVASVLNNLGVVLLALKKYAEAEPALLRSVHLYRTNQLPATQVAEAVFNLARLYYDQERFAESESLLGEVVAARNSHRHRASDEDAIAYEHYALALRRNGRTADAAAAEAQAKSIRTELRYTFKP